MSQRQRSRSPRIAQTVLILFSSTNRDKKYGPDRWARRPLFADLFGSDSRILLRYTRTLHLPWQPSTCIILTVKMYILRGLSVLFKSTSCIPCQPSTRFISDRLIRWSLLIIFLQLYLSDNTACLLSSLSLFSFFPLSITPSRLYV